MFAPNYGLRNNPEKEGYNCWSGCPYSAKSSSKNLEFPVKEKCKYNPVSHFNYF